MDPLILDLQVDNAQAINSINAFFDIYEKGVDGMAQSLGQALGKPVEVGVELKMEGGKIVASGVEKINKELDKSLTAAKLNNKEFGKTPAEIRKSIAVLKAIREKTQKYEEGTKKVTENWEVVSKALKIAEADLKKLLETAKEFEKAGGKGSGSLFNKLVSSQIAADALMGAFRGLTAGISNFIATGAEMEVLFLQLKGFTGGVEEARAAYDRFVQIGQATPFTAKQVATAARTMMGFGIETGEAIQQVEKLAIVASATGGDLGMMGRNLGQIQANQKAYTRDLMQFANQGIPIYQELATVMGTSTQHVRELAEEGKIGFAQVSAALNNLTKDGSVFQQIASEMDKTFAAKAEAMQSAFEEFAGRVVIAVNKIDQATGGMLIGAMELAIATLDKMADAAEYLGNNASTVGPILLTLAGGIAGAALAAKGAAVASFLLAKAKMAVAAAAFIAQAAMGKWAAVATGMIIAGGAAAMMVTKFNHTQDQLAEKTDEANKKLAEQRSRFENLVAAAAKLPEEQQKQINNTIELIRKKELEMDAHKQNAQMGLSAIKDLNEAEIKRLKDKEAAMDVAFSKERDHYKAAKDTIKNYYDSIIESEREALSSMRDRHNAELEMIDAKTPAERALQELQKKKLLNEQKGLQAGTEEWLQIQVRLDGMKRQELRQQAITRHKQETAAQEKKIKEAESMKTNALQFEEQRFRAKEKTYKAEKRMIRETELELKAAHKAQEERIAEMLGNQGRMQFKNHQEAMSYIDQQIAAVQRLGQEYEKALAKGERQLKTAQEGGGSQDTSGEKLLFGKYRVVQKENGKSVLVDARASGGPVAGGQSYTVNELGKEAFLSASGHLSMINAPSWGQWTAPSAGTVIPAHLTKELNIPAGGINLNQPAGMSRRAASPAMSGGDVFHQNVTVQAANPVQAANSMMVEMTRLRRRRFG